MSRFLACAVLGLLEVRWRAILGIAPLVLAAGFSLALASNAYATVFVANDGTDGPTCGAKKAPCRSIGRAVANAGAGDTIVVAPGHYGDLDGDGTLGEPGEEKLTSACGSAMGFSVLCLDKPVTLLSRDGAASTVIEARMVPQDYAVVVSAPGTRLGAPKKGFTIVAGEVLGLRSPLLVFGNGGTVIGNRLAGHFGGAAVGGSGHVFKTNQLRGVPLGVNGSAHQVVGNEIADASATGISIFRCRGCRVAGNLITRSGGNGIQVGDDDPDRAGPGNVVEGNVVSASLGHGFGSVRLSATSVATNVLFRANVASRNLGAGFQVDGTNFTLTGNVAIGNGVAGVQVDPLSAPPVLTANDFIGNGGGGDLCGVLNLSPQQIAATQSYWGAATGPGPRPADDACSGSGAGAVVTEPLATKPRKVKPKLPRIE